MNIKLHPTLTFTLKNKYKITQTLTSISTVTTTPLITIPTTVYNTPTHIHISPSLPSYPYIHTLSLCITNLTFTFSYNCIILSKPFTSTHKTIFLIEPYTLRNMKRRECNNNKDSKEDSKDNNIEDENINNGTFTNCNCGTNNNNNYSTNNNSNCSTVNYSNYSTTNYSNCSNDNCNDNSNNNTTNNSNSNTINNTIDNTINNTINNTIDNTNNNTNNNTPSSTYPNIFFDIPINYSSHTIYPFIFFYSNTDLIISYYNNNRVLLYSHINNSSKVIIYNKGVCSVSVEGVIRLYLVRGYLYVIRVPVIPMEVFIYFSDLLMFVDNTMYVYRGVIKTSKEEGNIVEGNSIEGNSKESNSIEGNIKEGNIKEGNIKEGNTIESNIKESNSKESNSKESNSKESNIIESNSIGGVIHNNPNTLGFTVDNHKDILTFKNIFMSNPSKVNIAQVGKLILLSVPEDSTIYMLDNTYTLVEPIDEINSICVRMNEEYEYCVVNSVLCDNKRIYLYDNDNVVCVWEYRGDNNTSDNTIESKSNNTESEEDNISDNNSVIHNVKAPNYNTSNTTDNVNNTTDNTTDIRVYGKGVILCKELLDLGFTVNNSSLVFNKDIIRCSVIPLINATEEDVCGVTPLDEEGYGLKGVRNMDILEGLNDSTNEQQAVSNTTHNYNPLNNSTNEQQGLNNSTNEQQGLNNSTNEQQGLNNSSNNTINNTINNTANNTANNTINNTTNIKDEVDEEIRRIKESIMNIKIEKKNIRTYSYFVEEQMGRVDTVLQRMYKKMVKCEKIQENGGYFNKLVGILRHKIISYTFLSIKSVRNSVEYFENIIFGRSCCVYEEGIIYGRENRGVVYEEGVSFKTDGVSDNVVVDIEERLKGVSIGEDIGSIGGVNTKGEYRGVNTNGNDNKGVNTNGNDYKGV
ncbi:hypothetical protein CWI39_1010p0010, partial [Hamiltosporidium magnivora]